MIGFQQTDDLANRRQAADARGGGGVGDSMETRQETWGREKILRFLEGRYFTA